MDGMARMVPGLDAAHFQTLQTDRRHLEQQTQPEPARELVGAAAGSARSGSNWRREVQQQNRTARWAEHAPPIPVESDKRCFGFLSIPWFCCKLSSGCRPDPAHWNYTLSACRRSASLIPRTALSPGELYVVTNRAMLAAGPQ